MKPSLLPLVAAGVVLLVAACGGEEAQPTPMSTPTSPPSPTFTAAAAPATTPAILVPQPPLPIAPPVALEAGASIEEEGTYVVEVSSGLLWKVGPAGGLRWSPSDGNVFFRAICCTEVLGLDRVDLLAGSVTRIFDNVMFYTLSPDGRKIAFTRFANGPVGLYLIGADGSGLTQLADEFGIASPTWSPTGNLIAFADQKFVRLIDLTTSAASAISEELGPAYGLGAPLWSPDGKRLAFCLDRGFGAEPRLGMYVYDVSDSSLRRRADDCSYPLSWSPDSTRLLRWGMFLVAADGAQPPQRLAEGRDSAWSPDGTRIAYVGEGCTENGLGDFDLYTISPDGGSSVRLTNLAQMFNETPAWSPAGDAIAFASYDVQSGESALLLLDPVSAGLRTLARSSLHVHGALWSAHGRYVAFGVTAGGHGICD